MDKRKSFCSFLLQCKYRGNSANNENSIFYLFYLNQNFYVHFIEIKKIDKFFYGTNKKKQNIKTLIDIINLNIILSKNIENNQ